MNKNKKKKQNISLIIGLTIPVAMIAYMAISINLPRWLSRVDPPQTDFLYMSGNPNYYALYQVKNQKLVHDKKPAPGTSTPPKQKLHFVVHSVVSNSNHEISFDQAAKLSLDGDLLSPDGYTLTRGNSGGGWFLYGGGNYYDRYLVKDNYSEKVSIITQGPKYRYSDLHFLGWILKDE